MDLKILILEVLVISICAIAHADEKRCFVCSSYMDQCKEHVYTKQGYAHKGRCYGKCFVRLGEDKAIYRGCFDAFREVPYLTSDYTGCKNQTWNGQTLPWCLCDGELCNKVSMNDLGYKPDLDLGQGYRIQGHDNAVYQDEYGTAHYVDEMSKYDQVPVENSVYEQKNNFQGQNQRKRLQNNDYGLDDDNKSNNKAGYDNSHDNNYAKEGYEVDGYEIKDVNHADIDLAEMKKLDKYMQEYYSENGYQAGDYGQDYNRFHYYQVDDPKAYNEDTDTQKYIAMDESEGMKVDASHKENELSEKQDSKKPEAKESAEEDIQNVNTHDQQNSKASAEEYGHLNSGTYNEGYNDRYAHHQQQQQQTFSQSNQFYEPFATNHRRDYNNDNRRQSGGVLKDEFKGHDQPEEREEEKEDPHYFPPHLAERIECAKTGFYQNPEDCRTFVACILDAHVRKPYMHLMRCPEGLVWDNTDKICNQYSTTCNVGGPIEGSYDIQDSDVRLAKGEVESNNSQQLKEDFIKYAGEKRK